MCLHCIFLGAHKKPPRIFLIHQAKSLLQSFAALLKSAVARLFHRSWGYSNMTRSVVKYSGHPPKKEECSQRKNSEPHGVSRCLDISCFTQASCPEEQGRMIGEAGTSEHHPITFFGKISCVLNRSQALVVQYLPTVSWGSACFCHFMKDPSDHRLGKERSQVAQPLRFK